MSLDALKWEQLKGFRLVFTEYEFFSYACMLLYARYYGVL